MSWTRRHWLATLPAGLLATPAHAAAPVIEWPALAWVGDDAIDAASLQGVPLVVVFWATYCAYCRRHNAHVDKLYRAVDARRLRVLGVALDSDAAGVRRTMAAQGYSFPVALDSGRLRRQFTDRRVIPMTCLVDREGRRGLCIPGEMAQDDVLGLAALALPGVR